jgi:molecular chaperone IbpA
MTTAFDFAPLFRSTIGFDRMTDLLDRAMRLQGADNWPPYDIEKTGEDAYRITMAVAGFAPEELSIVAQPNLLTVSGQKAKADDVQYLYRGLAKRSFKQSFELADYVEVAGAKLDNGLLRIELVREVPEAMKPRRIEVKAGPALGQDNQPQQIEHAKAA